MLMKISIFLLNFKDDNGKVASATITRGGNVEQPPKDALNPNILNNEFNTTVEKNFN